MYQLLNNIFSENKINKFKNNTKNNVETVTFNKTNNTSSKINTLNNIINQYDIISLVKNYTLDLDKKMKKFENNNNNDHNRELKNFFTDIVTNYILDEDSLFNLLYIINKLYTQSINIYIEKNKLNNNDIIFLLKGGNILKFMAEKFWNELPKEAMYKLIDIYKPYFKRSDLDFGIYINPNLNNSMKIIQEITIVSYKIQLIITDILSNNTNLFFKWFKYNKSYQNNLLCSFLKNINNLDILKNQDSLYFNNKFTKINFLSKNYTNQNDKYIKFLIDENTSITDLNDLDNNKTISQKINKSTSSNKNNFMYTSINNALKIHINKRVLEFNLTRTKINFNLYLQKNINNSNNVSIGGELIDVSIGHDEASEKFYKNKKNYIDVINLHNNNETFEINIYSYKYLYIDLRFILFEVNYFPWYDTKYSKRLYRLFYLTFINLLTNKKKIQNKHIKITQQYYKLIYDIILKFNNKNSNKNYIKKISNLLDKSKFKEITENLKCSNECLLNDLFKNINNIIEKVLYPRKLIDLKIHNHIYINNKLNNERDIEDNEFDLLLDFINIIKSNLDTLLLVNSYIENYSQNQIIFDYKNIDSDLLI